MTPDDRRAELERRAERVLAKVYGGVHNCVGWPRRKIDANALELSVYDGISTFDCARLTKLVVAAHDECMRVEMMASGPRRLKLFMTLRKREGGLAERHPTMEQAIATVRGEKVPRVELLEGLIRRLLELTADDAEFLTRFAPEGSPGITAWLTLLEQCAVATGRPRPPGDYGPSEIETWLRESDLSRAEHLENGNCWQGAYPCTKGCTGVCDRCHEHDEVRAACSRCERCLLCGRTGDDGKPVPAEVKEAPRG